MGTFIIVCAILGLLIMFGVSTWALERSDKKRLEGSIRSVIAEIKEDENLLKVIKLMIKNGKFIPEEIIHEVGNELTAKVIVERMQDLGVMSGVWFLPLVYQRGSKFAIHPFWLETLMALDRQGWDTDRLKLRFKTKFPI